VGQKPPRQGLIQGATVATSLLKPLTTKVTPNILLLLLVVVPVVAALYLLPWLFVILPLPLLVLLVLLLGSK
jgi:hypothetical protein